MPQYEEDFWNTIASSANPIDAWAIALPAVSAATGRGESEAIAFLESRRGSVLARDIATGLERGLPLDQAVLATADTLPRQMHEDWGGTLAPTLEDKGRRQGRQDAVLRYADHPQFGRLYWSYSSIHLSLSGGGGRQSDHFALVQTPARATGFSPSRGADSPLYGAGRHLSFLDHLERVGRQGLAFGSDAEQDAVLAWAKTADWRELPQPSSNACVSTCWIKVLVTEPPQGGVTVDVPGFPSCTSSGATEGEALLAAETALTEHLAALILAGQQMPRLFTDTLPDLPGARVAHLTILAPRPRRRVAPTGTELPGLDAVLTLPQRRRFVADLVLTGIPLGEALFDRGCTAYLGTSATPPNLVAAGQWFSLAAERGHTLARLLLGCLARDGHGQPRDIAMAIRCWEQTEHPLAFYLLGLAYSDGHGIDRDDAIAGHWFTKAASAGHLDATVRLLALLDNGRLAATDADQPLRLLQQAAALGNRAAHDRVFPITKAIMDTLFTLAMAAPPQPSPLREWRIVRLEEARPPEMPAPIFAGYLAVLYATQYLQPDQTPGFAQVWVYQLLGTSPFSLAEIGRRKPLI